jgi:hypothetical protein
MRVLVTKPLGRNEMTSKQATRAGVISASRRVWCLVTNPLISKETGSFQDTHEAQSKNGTDLDFNTTAVSSAAARVKLRSLRSRSGELLGI